MITISSTLLFYYILFTLLLNFMHCDQIAELPYNIEFISLRLTENLPAVAPLGRPPEGSCGNI
jgi:hypothetical protein